MGKIRTAITRVDLNQRSFQKKHFEPTLINFIYGTNGTGKTTISETFQDETKSALTIDSLAKDDLILVYNNSYIQQEVQNYGNMPGVFTLSKQNADIKRQIDEAHALRHVIIQKQEQTETKLEENVKQQIAAKQKLNNEVWRSTELLRKEKYPATQQGYKSDKRKLTEKLLEISPKEHTEDELDQLYTTAYKKTGNPYPTLSNVELHVDPDGRKLLSTSIVSHSETDFTKIMNNLGASDWVREGFRRFPHKAGDLCPYCHKPLDSSFEDDIAAAFDKTYDQDIAALKDFIQSYKNQLNNIYKSLHSGIETSFRHPAVSTLATLYSEFMERAQSNNQKLEEKLNSPATSVSIDSFDDILYKINITINTINAEIRKYNALLSDPGAKTKCNKAVWEELAFLAIADFAKYEGTMAPLKREEENLSALKQNYNSSKIGIDKKIKDLSGQTVNTTDAMNAINGALKSVGFQGFYLEEKPGTNLVYRLVRKDASGIKEVVNEDTRLSEGERNFIAFLYFYQNGIGSQSDDGVKRNKIVVIDDPVSSMDSGTLFVVASLIRNLIGICYNNYEPSMDANREDYIKQFFCLTHNPYFFREISYNHVDDFDCVSFYKIFKDSEGHSDIVLSLTADKTGNVSPVRNSYDALWHEYRTTSDATILLTVSRRILEYYFMQTIGKSNIRKELLEDHKEEFIDQNPDGSKNLKRYNLAAALISWLDAGVPVLSQELYYDASAVNVDFMRDVMKDIFDTLQQSQHYNMMWNRAQ